jgi:polysaccharide export outer membrane protein
MTGFSARSRFLAVELAVVVGLFVSLSGPLGAQATPPTPSATPVGPEVVVPRGRTAAQDAARGMGRSVSNEQIAEAIRRSGMSAEQIRARLQQSGHDSTLADRFFSGAVPATVEVPPTLVGAMQDLGLLTVSDSTAQIDSLPPARRESRVFGKSVFAAQPRAFEAVAGGPVDPGYRLGVSDVVQIVVTGDVEFNNTMEIRRDGTIIWPVVGQIPLAGLTLDAARSLVKQRASRVYSQIGRGSTQLDMTLSRVRSNLVYVIGEVERPSAYQVNALSTVFHALARAGGPKDGGTFRNIEVRRAGDVVQRIDLYEYLVKGDSKNDVRMESGDIIFVPPSGTRVTIDGPVRRAGIFELKAGERFSDLVVFAGGLLANASATRIQVDRILPPLQRGPGRERVLFDVSNAGPTPAADTLKLLDNDIVHVFEVGPLRRNRVRITGQVYEPGEYEWKDDMTLGELIARAQGGMPWALLDRVKVTRSIVPSGRDEQYSVDASDSVGARFPLVEFDEIEVLDRRTLVPSGIVTIDGAVNRPGERPYVERQTLRDLIDLSGGFREDAQFVEIARPRLGADFSDTTAYIVRFPITPSAFSIGGEASRFIIQRGDMVTVRVSPGFRKMPSVTLTGLFEYPGLYALRRDNETLRDIIERARLLPIASPSTFRLLRGGRVVPINLQRALTGDEENNIVLRQDDELIIGADPQTVTVSGAVERQVIVPFRSGWRLSDYLAVAGGRKAGAGNTPVVIEDASGGITRAGRRHRFFTDNPEIASGSRLTVLEKPPSTGGTGEALTRALQVTSAMVSLILAYVAATK